MNAPATRGWIARGLLVLVRAYRLGISPLLPASCRFAPTCSAYAEEAIVRFGAVRGTGMAVGRILRCHPFHPGGIDPVDGNDAARTPRGT